MNYSKENIKAFHDKGLLWMLIKTLTSKDNVKSKKDYENSKKRIQELKENLPNANINEEDKIKYIACVDNANAMLQNILEYINKRKAKRKRQIKLKKERENKLKTFSVSNGKFYI